MISNKPIRKTQTKLQPKEIAIRKTEGDSVSSTTSKVLGISQDAKACVGSNEEYQDPSVNNSECQNDMELEPENDHGQNSALVINSSTPKVVSYEVTVGV